MDINSAQDFSKNGPRDLPTLTPSKRNTDEKPNYPYPKLEEIASCAGFDPKDASIIDTHAKAGLVMIGPTDNLSLSGNLQGSIWASISQNGTRVPLKVMTSHAYPNEIVSHSLSIDHEKNESGEEFTVRSDNDVDLRFSSPVIATVGVEGLFVRLGRFRGYDIFANRRKIDASKSRWGDANYLVELKKTFPYTHDDIYEDTHSSNVSYALMITTPLTITGTRQDFRAPNVGYSTLLSVDFNWDQELFSFEPNDPSGKEYAGSRAFPRFSSSFDSQEQKPTSEFKGQYIKSFSYSDLPGSPTESLGLIAPVVIPPDEVESFLRWGYYDPISDDKILDKRVHTGESVILTVDGVIYKVMHPSFEWRNKLRRNEMNIGGDPKLRNPFYRAVILNFHDQETHDEWFLRITSLPIDTIKKHLDSGHPLVWIPSSDTSNIYEEISTNIDERRRVAFCNFIFSVPIHSQKEVLDFWCKLKPNLNKLTQFIIGYQRRLFHFLDVSEGSKMVTRLSTKENSTFEWKERGCKVERGANGWYYVFNDVSIPYGKYFVLLKGVHPAAARIARAAKLDAKQKSNDAIGDQKRKYSTWNIRAINRMIDSSSYIEVYQMIRQLDAVESTFYRN
jgi:hypothetical protein